MPAHPKPQSRRTSPILSQVANPLAAVDAQTIGGKGSTNQAAADQSRGPNAPQNGEPGQPASAYSEGT